MQHYRTIRQKVLFLLIMGKLLLLCNLSLFAQTNEEDVPKKILFICSYSSETKYISENIVNFNNEFNNNGGKGVIIVETINTASFSQALSWEKKTKSILNKHSDADLIVLLGGETWSCYLSLSKKIQHTIPVLATMSNVYGINLPTEEESLSHYHPTSRNLLEEMKQLPNVKCAIAYKYDINKDIELINKFYPNIHNLAFISDNTYNGLSQKYYIKEELKNNRKYNLIYIDGQVMNIDEASNMYKHLPLNTVALLGTWKIDKDDDLYISNSEFVFKQANKKIPVFSLTGSSIGSWAIGGYIPKYGGTGKLLGEKAYQILYKGASKAEFIIRPNHYQFDMQKVKELGFNTKMLPKYADLVNRQLTFLENYRYEVGIAIAICMSLFIGLLVSLYFYYNARALSKRLQASSDVLRLEKSRLETSEIELRLAKDHAEEANKMKSAFISNMSHEVRTPLNAIVGFSSLLVGTVNVTEEQKEYTEIIETNANLLLQLINDILDISQIEAGKMNFKYEWCEIVGHCRNIIRLTDHYKKSQTKLIFKPFANEYKLYTDPLRLQQIITNLLNNALKFTPENGTITLSIIKDEQNRQLLFAVTDTGCGIPEELHEKVFERFVKLDSFKQGTGLGLPICRLIIHHMGGEIWIDREYKHGTRFMFYHPIISI